MANIEKLYNRSVQNKMRRECIEYEYSGIKNLQGNLTIQTKSLQYMDRTQWQAAKSIVAK